MATVGLNWLKLIDEVTARSSIDSSWNRTFRVGRLFLMA